MQRNGKLLVMCLLIIPMLTLVFAAPPAASASSASMVVQPTMPWSQLNVYEMYGPRLDNIHMVYTGTPEASFLGLDTGLYDIIDWALSKAWKDEWEKPTRTDIKVMAYGGEAGYYVLDVREDQSKPVNPGWSTQSYTLFGDPTLVDITIPGEDPYTCTRAAAARRAIAHLIDRTWIVSTVMGGLGEPIYIPAPAAHGGFNSPNVAKYYQDFAKARELLNDAGVVDNDADGWRDIPGTNTELVLDFMIRLGIPRELAGGRIAADIETELKIQVNEKYGTSADAVPHVMTNREMDMYTGGWINVNFPDHYLDLYSSEGWWSSGSFAPNYMKYCGPHPGGTDPHFDEEIDTLAKTIVTSLDPEEVKAAAWAVQEKMMAKENVYAIGLVSTSSPKAWRTYMKGTAAEPGNEWKGIVNQTAQGVNNWWTFLNAHTDNMPNSGTITYGISYTEIDFLNPVYAGWYQTWEILDKIYDSLLYLDPIGRVDMKPWVASSFQHIKEYDPVQGEEVSVIYYTIRQDVYFHDGEQLTADDVIFSQVYLPNKLVERGLPPPWWDSGVRDIHRIEKFDDFHIKTIYEYPTYFAPINTGGTVILPEHKWKSIIDTGNPQAFCPEPTMTGSGPYQMEESDYHAGVSCDVYAYKPASVGYFAFSPIQTFIISGEVGGSSTYWVGASYVGAVTVNLKIYNNGLYNAIATSTTLDTLGAKAVTVPPNSWVGRRWNYPIAGGIGTVVGPIVFNAQTTWTAPPPPGIDTWNEVIYFKVTREGDVISTGDISGGSHVNVFDALKLVTNWGSTGPYGYPPADINWDGTVNILDGSWIVTNYGATGA